MDPESTIPQRDSQTPNAYPNEVRKQKSKKKKQKKMNYTEDILKKAFAC